MKRMPFFMPNTKNKTKTRGYGPVLAWNDPHVVNLSSEVSNADASASGVTPMGESIKTYIESCIKDHELKKTINKGFDQIFK